MIVPRPLKKVREKITVFSQEDKIPTFNLGSGTADSTTVLHGDGTWQPETDLSGYVPYTGATSDVDLGEHELKIGQVEFDQSPTGTAGVAVMRWNNTDGTVDVGLKGGNVTLQVGQEQVVRVVNKATVDLLEANYQAVKVSGATGQRLSVQLAQADNDFNSATTIGLVTETILKNQEGFITTSGQVKEINTTGSLQGETWVDGDVLYLSPTTAGNITNVKPVAPQHLIVIGYVEYAHANHGKIFVKVDNGYELDELHNVLITTPTNDDVLTYESSSALWKNKTLSTGLTVGTTAISSGADTRILYQNGGVVQQSASFTYGSGTLKLISSGTSESLLIRNSANSADIFSVLNGGAVLNSFLQVNGGLNSYLQFNSTNNSRWVKVQHDYGQLEFTNSLGNNTFTLGNNGISSFSGNVNIGGGTNGARLDVKAQGALSSDLVIRARNSANTADLFNVQGNGITNLISLVSSGGVYVNNSSNAVLELNSGGGVNPKLSFSTANSGTATACGYMQGDGNGWLRLMGGTKLNIGTGTGFAMSVFSNQNIAVGTSSDLGGRFQILAQGALSTDVALRVRNSANTADLLVVQGNGVTGLTTLVATNAINISQPAGSYYPTLNFSNNGGAAQGSIFGYNSRLCTTSILVRSGYGLGVGFGEFDAFYAQMQVKAKDALSTSNSFGVLDNGLTAYLFKVQNNGAIGIGTTSALLASAKVQIDSTTQGFLPPRMTNAQRIAIASPAVGLMVYCTDATEGLYVYKSTGWTFII